MNLFLAIGISRALEKRNQDGDIALAIQYCQQALNLNIQDNAIYASILRTLAGRLRERNQGEDLTLAIQYYTLRESKF